ncbi:MAG: DNA repair protein RecO [Defluviitaleaceae bacterium]|nr:DNA repair protein RecO [Defluviitaleaceae bacterium]
MTTIKVRGLVIKEYETGEADKRLLLLCKDVGRVMAYARGARKPRSKFMAAAQIFTYSDFVLAKGKGFHSVAQADVIENFYDLRTDYDKLSAAYKIVDACAKTVPEKLECNDLLRLILKSLKKLMKKSTDDKLSSVQILNIFFLRFFDFHGLRPHSEECAVCGLPVGEMNDGIHWGAEGITCATHITPKMSKSFEGGVGETFLQKSFPHGLELSPAAVAAISYVLNSNLSVSFNFEASEKVLEELSKANKMLWEWHYG